MKKKTYDTGIAAGVRPPDSHGKGQGLYRHRKRRLPQRSPQKRSRDRAYDVDVREAPSLARYCRQEHVDAIITSFSDLLFENMVKAADLAGLKCYLRTGTSCPTTGTKPS